MGADCKIAILGAGFGGIGMAMQLKAAGETSFVILEKADSIGGTWRDNTYPGSGCDVQSHLYSFSFAQKTDWSRIFARQPEILAYMEDLAAQSGLHAHLRLKAEVDEAEWDAEAGFWRILLRSGEQVTAKVFIAAWGQLHRPTTPVFEGQVDFGGESFHSARWPKGLELAGKRVAVLGTGASAIQLIPEVARQAASLSIFQRSASWIVPRMDRPYSPEELAAFHAQPERVQSSRREIHELREQRIGRTRLGSELAVELKQTALRYLEDNVADPELRRRLTPDYPIGCKRILISDDFHQAMTRPNVRLITEAVERLLPDGIRTRDGEAHALDVIIYATGFQTNPFLGISDIRGIGGRSMRDSWKDGAEAYLGITVSGFPNFFMLFGPNTNLGHHSILAMLEGQYAHILAVLQEMERQGRAADVRPGVMRRYNDELQAELEGSAWSGNCTNWYKLASGRIVNNWPGTVENYQSRTRVLDPCDYDWLEVPAERPRENAIDQAVMGEG